MSLGSDELPRGAHFEPGMRMVVVVVLEPPGDLPERGERIRQGVDANIVALEGFDEALGDAVRFRALHGSEAGHEIERYREVPWSSAGGVPCR